MTDDNDSMHVGVRICMHKYVRTYMYTCILTEHKLVILFVQYKNAQSHDYNHKCKAIPVWAAIAQSV